MGAEIDARQAAMPQLFDPDVAGLAQALESFESVPPARWPRDAIDSHALEAFVDRQPQRRGGSARMLLQSVGFVRTRRSREEQNACMCHYGFDGHLQFVKFHV